MGYRVLEVQQTPNPNASKFVLDRQISAVRLSFRTRESTKDHDVARQLMSLPGVVGLLLLNDFVTISKSSETRWADINTKAKRILANAD